MIVKKIKFHLIKIIFYLKYLILRIYYNFNGLNPRVYSFEKTLEKLLNDKISMSRYGDGEIRIIAGYNIEFQTHNQELSERLLTILKSDNSNHIIGIADVFSKLSNYKNQAQYFWKKHLANYYPLWIKCLKSKKIYYNAFISRPYVIYKQNFNFNKRFFVLKKIWENRKIVFVEGEKSRLGVNNDLFSNALSIERILCPPSNAYSYYREILKEVIKTNKNKLILIALGPTATVLAYDLSELGFQALDIGHIDLEYDWYRNKSKWMEKVENKHVNEAMDGIPSNKFEHLEYNKQIIKRIGC